MLSKEYYQKNPEKYREEALVYYSNHKEKSYEIETFYKRKYRGSDG